MTALAEPLSPQYAQAEADRLLLLARTHKSAATKHKRQTRSAMTELGALRERCAKLGIELTIQTVTNPPGKVTPRV
jgi:hypothetical protein